MGREGHCKRISLACVGSGCSLWITLGLPQPKAACASRVYTAHAPGGFVGALSQVDPVPHALPKSKPLRFSGTLQGHRPNWACILCLSQVRAAQATRCLVSALSQVGCASESPPLSQPLSFPVHRKSTISGVPCVSSGDLVSGCDPPGRCQPSRIPGRHG